MTTQEKHQMGPRVAVTFAVAILAAAASGFAQPPSVGLSALGAQRFGRLNMTDPNTSGGDRFASAFAVGDFDGDGVQDLATGIPDSDGSSSGPVDKCGAVSVRYGVAGVGLAGGAATMLGQFISGGAFANEEFGAALVACDLNDDGYDDLVVGVPKQEVDISLLFFPEAGVVQVYPGSPTGLPSSPSRTFNEVPATAFGFPAAGSHFGAALACGDFNGDSFADLAVGLPLRDLSDTLVDAGRVNIFPGSAIGLGSIPAYGFDQNSTGVVDAAEDGDEFGYGLGSGDFDGDGFADLAVAVPYESNPSAGSDGAFQVFYGSLDVLGAGGNAIFFGSSFGQSDSSSADFAFALAAGNFDGDAYDDLAIGSPLDEVSSNSEAGTFVELFGSSTGLGIARSKWFDEDSILGGGTSAAIELFGLALAAGDFDHDGVDDLAVASPYENVQGSSDGAVTVVMGLAGTGLSASGGRNRELAHGVDGVPGDPTEHGLYFGLSLAAGDFDGDGFADLAIGAPYESESLLGEVGTETILYGALFADGFESVGADFWHAIVPQL